MLLVNGLYCQAGLAGKQNHVLTTQLWHHGVLGAMSTAGSTCAIACTLLFLGFMEASMLLVTVVVTT